MMNLCCAIAEKTGCIKVVLTVFKHNEKAAGFYREKLGFVLDDTDPSIFDEETDYWILAKMV